MKYVAFLRGMNVGKRRIKNDELCTCFEALGYTNVAGFLASGNIIFEPVKKSTAVSLELAIEKALASDLGYDVPTFIRSEKELAHIGQHEAFSSSELSASAGKPQVILLKKKPNAAKAKLVMGLSTGDDKLVLSGKELHWLPSGGYLESKLDQKHLSSTFGAITVRTDRTIERLCKKVLQGKSAR